MRLRLAILLAFVIAAAAGCSSPPAATPVPTPPPPSIRIEPTYTAVPKSPTPLPPPTPTPLMYTVQPGDRLGDIAWKHNTTSEAIIRLNNIANPDLLMIGQRLAIPAGADAVSPPATAQTPAPAPTAVPPTMTPAPAQAPPTPTAVGAAAPRIHIVQPGERLGDIAWDYDTTSQAIMQANGITNADIIVPGQRLVIPSGAAPAPAPATVTPPPATAPATPTPLPAPAPPPAPEATPAASAAPCIAWNQARSYANQYQCVCGPVVQTLYAATPGAEVTFLDLGRRYPDPERFQVVSWEQYRDQFPQPPEKMYAYADVRACGTIEVYPGAAQMEVQSPAQISKP